MFSDEYTLGDVEYPVLGQVVYHKVHGKCILQHFNEESLEASLRNRDGEIYVVPLYELDY